MGLLSDVVSSFPHFNIKNPILVLLQASVNATISFSLSSLLSNSATLSLNSSNKLSLSLSQYISII